MPGKLKICIDRGGTFTDCIAFSPDKPPIVVKLLSEDPSNYKDAPTEGIRRILEKYTGKVHPRNVPVDTSKIELIRMGTTVATNALLERKGEKTALLITRGFRDLLHIGNQSRPDIFALEIVCPEVLYEKVIEIDERVTLLGYTAGSGGKVPDDSLLIDKKIKKGITGEYVEVLEELDLKGLEQTLVDVRKSGIKSIAIVLMHSFTYPDHEERLALLCSKIGFTNITLSSKIMPMIKVVSRGMSATADAYLTPCIKTYLGGFFSGFDDGLKSITDASLNKVKVEFMQSDGGLSPVHKFSGFRAILSGPAGGVVGYARTSFSEKEASAIIGFDMGGTSTDVSRYAGQFDHVFESTTAGVTIQSPQLNIITVAAGGGSRLFFNNGLFVVGPESAGANPGPSCYRKGGPLTITDANLILGRLIPEHFPKIFGPDENSPLDDAKTKELFTELLSAYEDFSGNPSTLDEIAYGFIKVANESMARPIRALTQSKGLDASKHILSCFGGAGGQHAVEIAKILGIKKILIHKYSSILSAYGLSLADVVFEIQEPAATVFSASTIAGLQTKAALLSKKVVDNLLSEGFPLEKIKTEIFLNLRYKGTDTALMTLEPVDGNWESGFLERFYKDYMREFGFLLEGRQVIVDDIRVRGIGKSIDEFVTSVHQEYSDLERITEVTPAQLSSAYWSELGRVDTPVYFLSALKKGTEVQGPALIIDSTVTIVVEPFCTALITSEHVYITVGFQKVVAEDTALDLIKLSIFAHRFMGIAEDMGNTLEHTAISTNIKERLDFSCALFDEHGGLVANAPHIPVHLGSMQEAVKWQMNHLGGKLFEGDVLVSNHPQAGGSHLPDITVITPVFNDGEIVFFVASRGHHADIGGIQPGSMPPNSRELYQEGAAIKSFKLVQKGKFDEEGISKLLVDIPAMKEGCSGSRCLKDNISDLKAQVAANHKGISLVKDLIAECGIRTVQSYMNYIQQNAELSVRQLLKTVAAERGNIFSAEDYMDDGTKIKLQIEINPQEGSAVFDFSGTGIEVYANWNAPKSITFSAIIYCLRCLVGLQMPLNQGVLNPIKIKIPNGSILDPSEDAAVVGGNVLTSQRLCDVIFKAFNACAASQGCCNNFTFGMGSSIDSEGKLQDGFGYYETIAGGSGAGKTWNGRSGVHVHMTNTRITDPEILERRYPVLLRKFGLRPGSGGKGKFDGGDGCIREIEFLSRMNISMLSERRVFSPYGIDGGGPGKPGKNTLIRKGGSERNFGGKNETVVEKGDRLVIETPGGGGYGSC